MAHDGDIREGRTAVLVKHAVGHSYLLSSRNSPGSSKRAIQFQSLRVSAVVTMFEDGERFSAFLEKHNNAPAIFYKCYQLL